MHRVRVVEGELMNPVRAAEVPPQPLDAEAVRHMAPLREDVPAAADEIGGVKRRLELRDDVYQGLAVERLFVAVVIKVVAQLRLGRGGPLRPALEVFFEQW